MSKNEWNTTDWGVETPEGYGLPIERCAELTKGRYVAIKGVCSRFYGDSNDVSFIRAWREALGRNGIPVDEEAFKVTIREITIMKQHFFAYRIAENIISPPRFAEDDGMGETVARYFRRNRNPQDPQIEGLTREILNTSSRGYRPGNRSMPNPAKSSSEAHLNG